MAETAEPHTAGALLAVADTGPLLHLAEIGQESELALFERVTVSAQVEAELTRHGVFERLAAALGERLAVESVAQAELDAQQAALSGLKLHQTDVSVAALAARLSPAVVLTDDLELRKALESQGRTIVGSVGVLVRAFKTGHFTKSQLQAHLDQLFDGSTLYLSKAFRASVRQLLDSLSD